MAASRRLQVAALVVALSACRGDGGDQPPPPPPPDAGGLWAGTWSNWSTEAQFHGPMVIELHAVDGMVSGFATIPGVDGGALGPAGAFGAFDQPLSGTVTGDAITLIGNGSSLAGWVDPPLAGSRPWERPVWQLERLLPPFEGEVAPTDMAGTWTVVPVSNMGQAPADETLTLGSVQGHVLDGTVQPIGGAAVDLIAGRSSGSTAWFAIHSDAWTGAVPGGPRVFRVWAGTFSANSGQGVYVEYQSQDLSLWDRGTWTASRP